MNYVVVCVVVSFRPRVTPKIFGCVLRGGLVLLICSSKLQLYSVGSGVNKVYVVLFGLRFMLMSIVHVCTLFRYGCKYGLAVLVLVCVDVMAMSSAYEVTCISACGMSDVYRYNSMGERTTPCRTPFFSWRVVDVSFLNGV